ASPATSSSGGPCVNPDRVAGERHRLHVNRYAWTLASWWQKCATDALSVEQFAGRTRRSPRSAAVSDETAVAWDHADGVGSWVFLLEDLIMGHQVTVQSSGHQFTVEPGQTVLDAALDAGILLPYSCKSGSCSSCKGRIVSGDVDRGHYQAQSLTEEEVAQGQALLCVAKPCTDLVIDVREVKGLADIPIKKMPCRVRAITALAPDVRRVEFQLPASEKFRFAAGQYIDLLLKDGRRRSYSMVNAPHEEDGLVLHIRHMPGGVFTDQVFGVAPTVLKIKDILRLEGPLG